MKLQKVLLITDIFPPDIGGPATFIDALAHDLVSKGYRPTVICTSEKSGDPSDSERPFRLYRLARHGGFKRRLQWLLIIGWQLLKHRIVLVNGIEYQVAKIAALVGRRFTLKIVGDVTWEDARNNNETDLSIDDFQTQKLDGNNAVNRARQMFFVRQAGQIIVPSEYRKRLVSPWAKDANIRVILNGTSLDKYNSYHPLPRTGEMFDLAFVGRLTNWKGVESVIRAVKTLRQVRFNIFGTGPDFDALKKMAADNPNVLFHGQVTGQKLRDTLHTMQALILTSSYEGLSHTLIEACALGLPSITSNCGGNPEVIKDGYNGFVVPYDDDKAIHDAIVKLCNEDMRFKLATNAKQSANDFDFNTTVQKTIDTLTQAA